MPQLRHARAQRGVVLMVVLIFALLLTSGIATFTRRAVIDAMIAHNRDAADEADALARGGVRLATAFLVRDRFAEQSPALAPLMPPGDSHFDRWYLLRDLEIDAQDGARLHLQIDDAGARLNLNALFAPGGDGTLAPLPQTEVFLIAFLQKMIDALPAAPGEKTYDPRELAENLIDWVDGDDIRQSGGPEDAYYQRQTPPYRPANGPLTSIDELGRVEGFDARLVATIRPYVTFYPLAGGGGINLNTAPPYVLSLIYYDDGVSLRFADEDLIRKMLEVREAGGLLCTPDQSHDLCTPMSELMPNANTIFPPPTTSSNAFTVVAEVTVGEVQRSVEAVVDRTDPTNPLWLSWRIR